jgi:hypothetical protein
MGREAYNECMKPYISGPHEDRKGDFCIGAKICSSKATDKEEAARLCAEAAALPRLPKTRPGKICKLKDLRAISVCLTENIDLASLTKDNMQSVFTAALTKCQGAQATVEVKSAREVLGKMDEKHLRALEAIARLTKEGEGRRW